MIKLVAFYFSIVIVQAVPIEEFFPFGATANDRTLFPNDDESSSALPLPVNFPYFNDNHRQIYLANNGLFSFLGPISTFVPQSFPLGNNMLLIAGFWSDIDTRPTLSDGNKVYYQIYGEDRNEIYSKAASYVRRYFPGVQTFNPTLVITGTWYKVGAYPSQTSRLNTFQIVLATDSIRSFAFLLYHDIQWASPQTNNGSIGGQAGFNAGDGVTFEMLPYSRTENVRLLPNISNVNTPGVFVFRIDSDQIDLAGCSNESQLFFYPRRGSQLGSTAITIQGPCFDDATPGSVKCRFGDVAVVDAIIVDRLKAICVAPPSPLPTSVQMYLSTDSGETYRSMYYSFYYQAADYGLISSLASDIEVLYIPTPIIYVDTEVTLAYFISESMAENQTDRSITLRVELCSVQLNASNQGITLERTFTLKQNISVMQGPQTQSININSIGSNSLQTIFFRILIIDESSNTIYGGLNSAIFILYDGEQSAQSYCRNWAQQQPLPELWNTNLLPCPMTLAQARIARCCYAIDNSCQEDSWNPMINCGERQAFINSSQPSAIACYLSTRSNSFSAGTECCYDEDQQLITIGRGAGSDDRYSALRHPVIHFFEDTLPFIACCHLSSNSDDCSQYYQLRPTRPGSNTWNSWGSTWGDPHFVTLDGAGYTFNGYGEYTYLAIPTGITTPGVAFDSTTQTYIFEAQVRTVPLSSTISDNRNRATVIRGFAAKSNHPSAEKITVTVSRRQLLIVQRGAEIVDLSSNNANPSANNRLVVLSYPDVTLEYNQTSEVLTLTWSVGVSIQISQVLVTSVQPNVRVLNIGASVSGDYRSKTFGLLGIYDDNQNNDLQASNGTVIGVSSSLSTEQIHYSFGQTWLIETSRSLFYYETGESATFYRTQSTQYTPSFSPIDPPAAMIDQVRQTCNIDPSASQSTWTMAQQTCYYDYAITNDQSLARVSRTVADAAVDAQLATRNPPEFSTNIPSVYVVNPQNLVQIDFSATSAYTDAISYNLVRGPSGAIFSTTTGRFSWTPNPSTDNNTWVRVSATDSANNLVSSRELIVRIVDSSSPASRASHGGFDVILIGTLMALFSNIGFFG